MDIYTRIGINVHFYYFLQIIIEPYMRLPPRYSEA